MFVSRNLKKDRNRSVQRLVHTSVFPWDKQQEVNTNTWCFIYQLAGIELLCPCIDKNVNFGI